MADTSAFVPLIDLGTKTYKGVSGGLYPNGQNQPPPEYRQLGLRHANAIRPLDAAGQPAPAGKIGLLSIGMSNTTMEFSAFQRLAAGEPRKTPQVVLVDGAQGGADAERCKDPKSGYWTGVEQRLQAAGVTAQQVQAVWLKQAIAQPHEEFPADAQRLQQDLVAIIEILTERFPNLQIVYLSSRIYGGYATTRLNPEPYAYEGGFAVKWLIEENIKQPGNQRPWLAWGPYLWANGTKGRGDGLTWDIADVGPDGTHPSEQGRMKVARLLLGFFTTDETAKPWFLAPGK